MIVASQRLLNRYFYIYLLFSFLAIFLCPLAVHAESQPPSRSENILRLEPWEQRSVSLSLSFPHPTLLEFFSAEQRPILLGYDMDFQLGSDWAFGAGLGVWEPNLYLSAFGRYYLPVETFQDVPALAISRFFAELRSGFLIVTEGGRLGTMEGADKHVFWNALPRVGLESRWESVMTRFAVGLGMMQEPNGRWMFSPSFNYELGFAFTSNENLPSTVYQEKYKEALSLNLSPTVQLGVIRGVLEGDSLSFWLMHEHWALGYFQGSFQPTLSNTMFTYDESYLPEDRIGFKVRYYPDAIGPGVRWFVQATGNLTTPMAAGLSIGLAQRELWGMVTEMGVGINTLGAFHQFDSPLGLDIYFGISYAWSLADYFELKAKN